MADLFENADGLLSITAIADMSAVAETTLYTVPAGKTLIITKVKVRINADLGASCTVTVGQDGAETDFVGTQTLSNLDAQFDVVTLAPIQNATPVKEKEYVAAELIKFAVTAGGNAIASTVYLYGTLDDA